VIRTTRFSRLLAPLAAVAALALAGEGAAQVVKPFKITGEGIAAKGLPLPGQPVREHVITKGQATHLGNYTGAGAVRTDSAVVDPVQGVITGEFGGGAPFVFTGANGDKLVTWYGRTDHGAEDPGTFELTIVDILPDGNLVVEAAWIAEFVAQPDLSTGKFAGVTGSWIMYAFSEPFVLGSDDPLEYWWEGEGTLTFPKK
jgi:hypothetical protein